MLFCFIAKRIFYLSLVDDLNEDKKEIITVVLIIERLLFFVDKRR